MKADILLCINHAFTDLARTCLFSLKRSAGFSHMRVFIVNRDLSDKDKARIRRLEDESLSVEFVSFDASLLKGAPSSKRYPIEIYFRLFAPEILPQDVERVLYLDVDTVCINSLTELYASDMSGCAIMACSHTKKTLTRINAARLGVKTSEDVPYINTGVMLMDLVKLRGIVNKENIFSFIKDKGWSLMLPDQDIIMALYGTQVKSIPTMRYNLSDRIWRLNNLSPSHQLSLDDIRLGTSIIHYCGRYKPWKDYYKGRLGVFWQEAREQLDASGL